MADIWLPLRAGSDVVFLGALVNYVIANGLTFFDYVIPYTNAATIIGDEFRDTEDLNGLFSGWDSSREEYSNNSWAYAGSSSGADAAGGDEPERDPSLKHPRCVFQILARHFSRYTPAMVEEVCGIPADSFGRVADAFCRASGPERTAAICYAVGWTQHSTGVQTIRTAAILQLLLGNIGRPGGGILALRGHASIQGSTDIPTLYDLLPGYLPMPTRAADGQSIAGYVARNGQTRGLWKNIDKYLDLAAQGLVRQRGNVRERVRLRLAAAHQRRPLAHGLLARHGRRQRQDRGAVRDGTEPRGRCAERAARAPRARQPEMAGRARPGRNGDRDVLARFTRDRARRAAHGRCRHRGLLSSGGGPRRKERLLHQHAAPGPVARQGRRATRRRTQRCLVRLPPRRSPQGDGRERFTTA